MDLTESAKIRITAVEYTPIYMTHGNVVQKLRAYINSTVDYFSYHYDAFGNHLDEERSSDINPFRYCGEYWGSETGEVYLRARYYSPTTGRFTTIDPAMDGTNWYVYCTDDPVNFVDPWGLFGSRFVSFFSKRRWER